MNRQNVAEDILRGLEHAAEHDLSACLITLTSSRPEMQVVDFNRAFTRLRSNLQRAGIRWLHYLSTLGCAPDGSNLHRHVIATGGPELSHEKLKEYALRVGLGGIVDIRPIGLTAQDRRRVSDYVANNTLAFAVAHANSGTRIAPVSRSRGR